MHLAINSGSDLALFNAWLTYIASKGWTDKAFIDASTKNFDKARRSQQDQSRRSRAHHRPDRRPNPAIGGVDRPAEGRQRAAANDVRL